MMKDSTVVSSAAQWTPSTDLLTGRMSIADAKMAIRSNPRDFFSLTKGILPLVIFCNPKSGGNAGKTLLEAFRKLIDPGQVYDMMEKNESGKVSGAITGLKACRSVKKLLVLVCGGDGTVGWVLSNIEELNMQDMKIPVGVVPLGTGNDLANTLKAGSRYTGAAAIKLLEGMVDCCSIPMDRWNITVKGLDGTPLSKIPDSVYGILPVLQPPQPTWNNYFSFGSDAHCTLSFHTKREKNPERFTSRTKNRLAYAIAGAKEAMFTKFKGLVNNIRLVCDGVDYTERLKTKKIVSIGFLNIPYIGGGTRPWGAKDAVDGFDAPKIWDGKVEVVGFVGQFSLMKAQAKSSILHALRICQARNVELTLLKPMPVQLDGEPCLFGACTINLNTRHQAIMLAKRKGRFEYLASVLDHQSPSDLRSDSMQRVMSMESDDNSIEVDSLTITVHDETIGIFVVGIDSSDTSIASSSRFTRLGSISQKDATTVANAKKHIATIFGGHPLLADKNWGLLEYVLDSSSSIGSYSFVNEADESKRTCDLCFNPEPGARKGIFIADRTAKISMPEPSTLLRVPSRKTMFVRNVSEV